MKSLLQLIDETLSQSLSDSTDRLVIAVRIERLIKDEAKSLFFKGQISKLIDYLCAHRSGDNELGIVFQSKIAEKETVPSDFSSKLQITIASEMSLHNLQPNLEGLLTLLQLRHLSPMLSMFRI